MEYTRFKDIRIDNDMTQAQIAIHLQIATRTYSGYENGTRNIPVQYIIKLARLYKTSTDYLLGLTDVKRPYPSRKDSSS